MMIMASPHLPLKVVVAVHHFPPNFKGGAEWRAHRTAKWLQQQGHTVKVICVEAIDDPTTPNLRFVDDEFDGLPVRRLYLNLAQAPEPARWEYDNPWIEEQLTHYLTAEKPDIFHLISGYLMTAAAIKAAKNLAIPVILTLTDFWFLCPRITLQRSSGPVCPQNTALDCARCHFEAQRRFRLPAQKLPALSDRLWRWGQTLPPVAKQITAIEQRQATLQAALDQVDVAICPSQFLLNTYLQRGFKTAQMRFLRQGLAHLPLSLPQKLPADKLRAGYIGQLGPHKGVHLLIEAFKKLDNDQLQLKIYGDLDQFPAYTRQLQQMTAGQPNIQWLGPFANNQIGQIYQELDLLVVPSVWYENSPNVILEAFAHHTPVLASNLGGMAELVQDNQTGLLFAPNDAADLALKLKKVVDRPALLNQFRQNIVPTQSLETEMNELLQIYYAYLPEIKINH